MIGTPSRQSACPYGKTVSVQVSLHVVPLTYRVADLYMHFTDH